MDRGPDTARGGGAGAEKIGRSCVRRQHRKRMDNAGFRSRKAAWIRFAPNNGFRLRLYPFRSPRDVGRHGVRVAGSPQGHGHPAGRQDPAGKAAPNR